MGFACGQEHTAAWSYAKRVSAIKVKFIATARQIPRRLQGTTAAQSLQLHGQLLPHL